MVTPAVSSNQETLDSVKTKSNPCESTKPEIPFEEKTSQPASHNLETRSSSSDKAVAEKSSSAPASAGSTAYRLFVWLSFAVLLILVVIFFAVLLSVGYVIWKYDTPDYKGTAIYILAFWVPIGGSICITLMTRGRRNKTVMH